DQARRVRPGRASSCAGEPAGNVTRKKTADPSRRLIRPPRTSPLAAGSAPVGPSGGRLHLLGKDAALCPRTPAQFFGGALTCGWGKATDSQIRAGAHAISTLAVGRARFGDLRANSRGACSNRVRPSRWRLHEFPDPHWRSGGLRRSLRTRATLPCLELLVSTDGQRDCHLLVEEPGARPHGGQVLCLRRS